MKTLKFLTLALIFSWATQGCTQNETAPAINYEVIGCEKRPADPMKELPFIENRLSVRRTIIEIGSYKYQNNYVYVFQETGVGNPDGITYYVYNCNGKVVCQSFSNSAFPVDVSCWKKMQKEFTNYELIYKK
jgi:hypothetical protein